MYTVKIINRLPYIALSRIRVCCIYVYKIKAKKLKMSSNMMLFVLTTMIANIFLNTNLLVCDVIYLNIHENSDYATYMYVHAH